jgi:hypothetical protein
MAESPERGPEANASVRAPRSALLARSVVPRRCASSPLCSLAVLRSAVGRLLSAIGGGVMRL